MRASVLGWAAEFGMSHLSSAAGQCGHNEPSARSAAHDTVSRSDARFSELVADRTDADREAQREAQGSEFPPPGPLRDWVRTQIARLDTLVPALRLRLTQLPFWPELRAAAACPHYTLRRQNPA